MSGSIMALIERKILLLQQDQKLLENTRELLQLAGYLVLSAEDGRRGLKIAKIYAPDLIICALDLPKLDAYGLLQILMSKKDLRKIPVIVLGKEANHAQVRKAMDLGASDFISNLDNASELLSAVESRLRKRALMFQSKEHEPTEKSALRFPDLKSFLKQFAQSHFAKGQMIYCEGNSGNQIYYLVKGAVKAYKVNETGKEMITEVYRPNDLFGLTSLFEFKSYPENAMTLTPSELIKIPREAFIEELKRSPKAGLNLLAYLIDEQHHLKDQMMHLAYDSVRKKTASALLRLVANEKNKRRLGISRTDLANFIGIAKETLARTLAEFKAEKLIKTEGNTIVLTDPKRLTKIKF